MIELDSSTDSDRRHKLIFAQCLSAVAWADGLVTSEEHEIIGALADSLELEENERVALMNYAQQKRDLSALPLAELSESDRKALLAQSVIIAYADGALSEHERSVLTELARALKLSTEEAKEIIGVARSRAERHLELLKR